MSHFRDIPIMARTGFLVSRWLRRPPAKRCLCGVDKAPSNVRLIELHFRAPIEYTCDWPTASQHGRVLRLRRLANGRERPRGTLNTHTDCCIVGCIRILVATDNHIGYAESDPIRGQDSINTFREILQLAIAHDVDMLLLAGDLFHHNRPSRASLYSTIASLREYCLNSRPIRIELVGDAGIGIPHGFNQLRGLRISMSVFQCFQFMEIMTDPQGIGPEGALCALDVLSASGLVNYFGRQELPGNAQNDEEALEDGLHIQPILLQKGTTRLAMYGIGNIRDERFHYEMRSNRIRMSRPAEYRDEWFNLMLVHQNRVAHGPKNSVPENGFGREINLVIWGHEHDCLIEPYMIPEKGYYISQPGSSIATSLARGESLQKKVGVLEIQGHDFAINPITLKTVRPFVFHDIILSDEEEENNLTLDTKTKVIKYLTKLVELLISQANAEWDERHVDDDPAPPRMLPLIRLRVEYTRPDGQGAYEVGNPQRIWTRLPRKDCEPERRKPKNEIDHPEDEMAPNTQTKSETIQVSTFVRQYLEAQNLGVLAENGMQKAVSTFVEKDDKDAIKSFYDRALKAAQAHVKEDKPSAADDRRERGSESEAEELVEGLAKAKDKFAEEWDREDQAKSEKKGKGLARVRRADDDSDDSDWERRGVNDEDEEEDTSDGIDRPATGWQEQSDFDCTKVLTPGTAAATSRTKSSTKASGSGTQTTLSFSQSQTQTQGRSTTARHAKKTTIVLDEDDEDDEDIEESEEDDPRYKKPSAPTYRTRR
ncbi:double-strand break repair protein MRE11 [Melampsora americana]|nr:double-strand break repair protein MRE11 [Melampsora americana]